MDIYSSISLDSKKWICKKDPPQDLCLQTGFFLTCVCLYSVLGGWPSKAEELQLLGHGHHCSNSVVDNNNNNNNNNSNNNKKKTTTAAAAAARTAVIIARALCPCISVFFVRNKNKFTNSSWHECNLGNTTTTATKNRKQGTLLRPEKFVKKCVNVQKK